MQEGVAYAGVHYAVDVLLLHAAEYGVEVVRNLYGRQHGYVVRQAGVHRQRQPVDGDAALRAEVGAVVQRVDSGVRASAAGDPDRVAADLGERLFHRRRDGDVKLLHLPAVVGAAVIAEL